MMVSWCLFVEKMGWMTPHLKNLVGIHPANGPTCPPVDCHTRAPEQPCPGRVKWTGVQDAILVCVSLWKFDALGNSGTLGGGATTANQSRQKPSHPDEDIPPRTWTELLAATFRIRIAFGKAISRHWAPVVVLVVQFYIFPTASPSFALGLAASHRRLRQTPLSFFLFRFLSPCIVRAN